MFRYYDVMEFAIGQNDLKDLLCGILGSENGLSTYNALDFLTFLASLQMIMSGIVISQSQANNVNNIAQRAAYQNQWMRVAQKVQQILIICNLFIPRH